MLWLGFADGVFARKDTAGSGTDLGEKAEGEKVTAEEDPVESTDEHEKFERRDSTVSGVEDPEHEELNELEGKEHVVVQVAQE